MLEEAEHFIFQHTGVASHFENNQLQRIDTADYPYMAIRETLINAFCHRDYSHNQGYVSVEAFIIGLLQWNGLLGSLHLV